MNFFMLTPGGSVFKSLKRFLDFIQYQKLRAIKVNPFDDISSLISEVHRIGNFIELETNKVRNTVVFIDPGLSNLINKFSFAAEMQLNPISSETGLAQLLSLLILAFPEIHWIFLPGISILIDGTIAIQKKFHFCDVDNINKFITDIIHFSETDLVALFDPCGLRNSIKSNIHKQEKGVPKRTSIAAAIDEEISYALMNAYTAYRFGYRAWSIPSLKMMDYVFKNKEEKESDPELVFEDLYLNFPDKPDDIHLSNLEVRDNKDNYPKLKTVRNRILVTVGHKNEANSISRWQNNQRYLKYKFSGKSKILYKPLAGIFDLWKKAGRWSVFKNIPIPHEDFIWPPAKHAIIYQAESTHGARGRLLLVAEMLLKRSEKLLKFASSVEDSIQAATLALEAKELLACKTPTIALEALSLQQQAEVQAECMFYGVEYDFDVRSRILDVKKEVKAISVWFHFSAKQRSKLNAEISIFNMLAQQYRKYGQFDEENVCLHEVRKLTTSLWVSRKPIRILLLPFRSYINFLLKSLGRFAFVILLWIFSFGFLYWGIAKKNPKVKVELIDSIIISAKTFLAFQPPDIQFWVQIPPEKENQIEIKFTPIRLWFFIIPAVLGFIHLGIFISHLNIILMRRPGG